MINTLLGIKKDMTSTYDSRGRRVGATIVEVTPNFVTQIKTSESKDGYDAVQLGYGTKKSVRKPQLGIGKKAGIEQPIRWFREIEVNGKSTAEGLKPGTDIKLNQVFSIGDAVKVSGVSKGKGFQGGMRRHGFHGGPKTHGQSDRWRAPGSIGSGTTPGRVYKGKKMAGHMGDMRASVKNLEIVGLDKQKNLLIIKGGIPGTVGSLVTVTKLGRVKGYTPPPEEKIDEESASAEAPADKEETSEAVDQDVSGSEEQKAETPANETTEIPAEEVKSSDAEVMEDKENAS